MVNLCDYATTIKTVRHIPLTTQHYCINWLDAILDLMHLRSHIIKIKVTKDVFNH